MKAKKLLKTKNIKDTLFRDGNWITGGLSELMNEFANQQNKELINKDTVLKIVDSCFHQLASSYRNEAEMKASVLFDNLKTSKK